MVANETFGHNMRVDDEKIKTNNYNSPEKIGIYCSLFGAGIPDMCRNY